MWGLGSREIKPSFCLLLLLIKSHEVYTYEEAPPRLHLMEALPYYHCTISWKPFMTWLWMNCNQVTTSFHLSFVNSHLLSSLCCLGQVSLHLGSLLEALLEL
jgi:hypothetical protein